MHPDSVTDASVVLLVVDVELPGLLNRLAVQAMANPLCYGYDNRLLHGTRHDNAFADLA
jgi:hypothetical protein